MLQKPPPADEAQSSGFAGKTLRVLTGQDVTRGRLWIVDPSLKDFVGHHFEYDAATREGAAELGYETICLAHREASAEICEQLTAQPTFSYDIWGGPSSDADPVAAANALFFQELSAAAPPNLLRPGDIVFGHMITKRQLHAFARYAEAMAPAGAQLVLLLRYEPAHYLHPLSDEAAGSLATAARRGVRVRLTSDSARLADQFERIFGRPVDVLPIPHTSRLRPAPLAALQGRPLTVVSLGNARDEKGLLELFDAVRILKLMGEADRFAFALQVNNPTKLLEPAIAQFAREGHENVQLLHEPLPSDAYYELLRSADLVALPYWRSVYEARTSGVLLEAIGAGKPVICTADTWMSDQLEATGSGLTAPDQNAAAFVHALRQGRVRFEDLAGAALRAAEGWTERHNPRAFAEQLVTAGVAPPRIKRLSVAVLYPWGDGLARTSGASQRVNSLVDLLSETCAEVRVLQDTRHPPERRGNVQWEATPVLERAESHLERQRYRRRLRRLGAQGEEDIYLRLADAAAHDAELQARVDELVRASDIVFLEYPFWAQAVAESARRWKRPWVATAHDILSDQVKTSARWLRWATRRMEVQGLARADHVATLSREDAARLQRWGVKAQAVEVGLDVGALRPLPADVRPLLNVLCELPRDDTPLLLFVGSRYGPNIEAADALRRMAPQLAGIARIVVAGGCAEPETSEAFTALGRVDDLTLRLLYQCSALALSPMEEGTGASVKAVDALASGTPLLSTSLGVRGVPDEVRGGCLIEDDLSVWPSRIANLLQDETALADLRAAAQSAVEQFDSRRKLARYLDWLPGGGRPAPPPATYSKTWVRLGIEAAQRAVENQLLKTAESLLDGLRAAAPNEPDLVLAQARAAMTHRRPKTAAAKRLLYEALALGADPSDVLRAEAQLASDRRAADERLGAAARFAASHIVLAGGEHRVRATMWSAFHKGDRDWARAIAIEVAETWPHEAVGDYYYLAALTEFDREHSDLDRAKGWASTAVAKAFDPFWSARLLGAIESRRGEVDAACEAFRLAYAAAKPDQRGMVIDGLQNLAWISLNGQGPGRAAQIAREIVDLEPGSAIGHYLLAECARISDDPATAEPLYARAAELGYDPHWCAVQRGRLLLAHDDNPIGRDLLEAALQDADASDSVRQSALDGLRQWLWSHYNAGRIVAVGPHLSPLLALQPDMADAQYLLGEYLTAIGDPDGALEAYLAAEAQGYDPYWALRRAAEAAAQRRRGRARSADELRFRLKAATLARKSADRDAVLDPLLNAYEEGLAKGDRRQAAALEAELRQAGIDLHENGELVRLAAKGRLAAVIRAVLINESQVRSLEGLLLGRRGLQAGALNGGVVEADEIRALCRLWSERDGADREAAAMLIDAAVAFAAAGPGDISALERQLVDHTTPMQVYARAELLRHRKAPARRVTPLLDAAAAAGADARRIARSRLLLLDAEARAQFAVGHPEVTCAAFTVASADERALLRSSLQAEGWSAFYRGAHEFALAIGEVCALIADEDASVRYLLAEALQALGRHLTRAERHYGEALLLGFDPFWARFNRAQVRAKLGQTAAALDDLEIALRLAPDLEAEARTRRSIEALKPESSAA